MLHTPPPLQAGDLVRLAATGPRMKIASINGEEASCVV